MTAPVASRQRYDVIVIGGGHNGLTAAAWLARRGRRVVVLERRPHVGGLAVGDEFHPGCVGLGLLHETSAVRPWVVETLGLERFGLEWTDGPPSVYAPQENGPGLRLHHDPGAAAAELDAISPRDAEGYAAYRAFIERVGGVGRSWFDERPPRVAGAGFTGVLPLAARALAARRLGRADLSELLRVVPMSVHDWLSDRFESEILKSVLAAGALAGGFTGPRSPGTAACLLRQEVVRGPAVRGGGPALVDALAAAAAAAGAEVRTDAEVGRIRVGGGGVEGAVLADGETIDAPVVAASCDPRQALGRLVPPTALAPALDHHLRCFRMRGTTAKVDLVLRVPLRFAGRPEETIPHARTGATLDDLERAFDAVKYGRCSERPVLDVVVREREAGCLLSVIAHAAPYDLAAGWSDVERERLGDRVVAELARTVPDLPASIVARRVLAPPDIERRYGVTNGHVHHGEHALDQLIIRPTPECARYATPIPGLYLCGSGSHPGGGLTCAPGALAATAILNH